MKLRNRLAETGTENDARLSPGVDVVVICGGLLYFAPMDCPAVLARPCHSEYSEDSVARVATLIRGVLL